MKYYLNDELFVIPNGYNRYILFLPLECRILTVNRAGIVCIKNIENGFFKNIDDGFIQDLISEKILINPLLSKDTLFKHKISIYDHFEPTSITLSITSKCNLRCTYCYASAGDTNNSLKFNTAMSAINYIFRNANKNQRNSVSILFHGGGEPFSAFLEMKKIVEYVKLCSDKSRINASISTATNGVLSEQMLQWIKNNLNSVSLSLDGPPDIQNSQRPTINGHGSSSHVERTIIFFEKHGIPYNIRSTITKNSVDKMQEIIDYLISITTLNSFHFEPVFECGRCKYTHEKSPSNSDFLKYFRIANCYANNKGKEIFYSGAAINKPRIKFCGAAGSNFLLTPTGYITTCYEVTKKDDPLSNIFFIGNIDRNGKIHPKVSDFGF